MHLKGRNYWLVALGVLIILVGVVDAAGVVGARPASVQSRQASTPALPPEDFGPAHNPTGSDSGAGFLPMQAPSREPAGKTAFSNPRLSFELDSEGSLGTNRSGGSLPTAEPPPPPEIPRRIWIPAIQLYAPVLPMELELVEIDGVEYDQWKAPDEPAAGWHASSAPLGKPGNTVLNGHHNIYGEVFRDLVDLKEGDEIILYSDNLAYRYAVVERVIFPERFAKPEQRVQNAELILPSQDERLTLITCWPYESNTHRLVLIAKPIATNE